MPQIEDPDEMDVAQLSRDFESLRVVESPGSRLPEDILLIVFEILAPPPDMLKFSYLGGRQTPYSLALRTMTSIPLVCRRWYRVSVPFLYTNVVIRRFSEIALLRRTLRREPGRFGPLVKRLTFACAMHDDQAQTNSIEDIIEHCRAVRWLSFEGLADMDNFQLQIVLQSQEDDLNEQTREDETEDEDTALPFNDVYTIALASSTLSNIRSLSVHLNSADGTKWRKPLLFPQLETLILWFQRTKSLAKFPDPWVTPALKDLRFHPTLCAPSVSGLLSFLKPREDHLESLDFGTRSGFYTFKAHSLDAVERVVKRCGKLKHVVFQLLEGEETEIDNLKLFSRPLEYVDIVVLGRMCSHPPFTIPQESAWGRIRYFDRALLDLFPDIAHALPAAQDPPKELEVTDVYGFKIKQMGTWVYSDDIFGTAPRETAEWSCYCSGEETEDEDEDENEVTESSEVEDESESDSDSEYKQSESDSDNSSDYDYVSDPPDSGEES